MKHRYISISALAISLIFTILFYSCGSDTVTNTGNTSADTSTFTYPFTIGSSWSYNRTYTASDIRPDSIRHYFTVNPIRGFGTITVVYDTLINNISARCFTEEYTELSPDTNTYHGRFYFIQTDSSLLEVAYRGYIYASFIPSRKHNNISFNNDVVQGSDIPDSLYILNPPRIILKYPIRTGTQWINIYGGAGSVTRRYELFENVTLSSGIVTCMKVSTAYSGFNSSPVYDYYSKFGLMKKYWFINDEIVSTPQYPEGIGTVDYTDDYEVSSYHIVN